MTNAAGQQVSRHDFLPFGEESTSTSGGDVALKFTGHERDQPGKPMDYMHARSASPLLGRFLRPDPSRRSARFPLPQTWNRYYLRCGTISSNIPTQLEKMYPFALTS